jgi:murein DD-endopeptidase MepM/ murein hydrolase activator NlpD
MVVDPLTLLLALFVVSRAQSVSRARRAARVFPVTLSAASFSNDYSTRHQGIDIFAAAGTAVYAPEDGKVRFTTDPSGGLVFYLQGNSGTRYYGAHLSGYVGSDRVVRAGDQIGFVGNTGNARTTAAHLHFQMEGGASNPYSFLHALAPGAPGAPYTRGLPTGTKSPTPDPRIPNA